MKSISEAAIELLKAIYRKQGSIPVEFRASDLTKSRCAGHSKVETVNPLLEELSKEKLLEEKEFSWGSHKYATTPIETVPLLDYLNSSDEEVTEEDSFTEEIIEDDSFTEDDLPEGYRESLEEDVKAHKKFIITTAVVDKDVNIPLLNSLINCSKRIDAPIYILPSDTRNTKENSNNKNSAISLDKKLGDFKLIYKDLWLNNNLCICSIKTSAKQIKTLTGLDRIATKKNASIIIASTKQFEEPVPVRKGKTPLSIVTTGAVTLNNYDTDHYMSKRTAYIAEEDHMYGAAIVEIVDDEHFHVRLIEAAKDGSITDLGVCYKPDGSAVQFKEVKAVLGDVHTERVNKALHKPLMRSLQKLNVDTVILHDIFNATSITHHDKGKNLTRAIKASEHRLSLNDEGEQLKRYLTNLNKIIPNITVVNSNHDRHLDSYLEEGRYVTDPINSYTAHKLAIAYMEKQSPLKYLLVDLLKLNDDNIKWLKQDESYLVYGVECGNHGDAGINGARGSLVSFEKGLGNCVTAHTHSGKRLRYACCVGTIAELDQDYNKGLTTWTHTICVIYPNGTKQLIRFIPDKRGNYKYTTM